MSFAILIFYFPYDTDKWITIFPHEEENEIFLKETNALHCYHCYPDCEDVNYDILSWKSYMSVGGYNTNLL